MTRLKRFGGIATIVAGATLATGSCGSFVQANLRNVEGDGWEPSQGLVPTLMGVDRAYHCELTSEGWEKSTFLPSIKPKQDGWGDFYGGYFENNPSMGLKGYAAIAVGPFLEFILGVGIAYAGSCVVSRNPAKPRRRKQPLYEK